MLYKHVLYKFKIISNFIIINNKKEDACKSDN